MLSNTSVEGDQVNRKGALTGGFIDVRTSRIDAMRTISTLRETLKKLTAKAEKLKAAIQGTWTWCSYEHTRNNY